MSDHQPIAPATAELATLDALVGTWNWNGRSSDGSFEVTGQTSFEWLTGGHFLIERAALRAADDENTSIAVVGVDSSGGGFIAHYFDSEGVSDTYHIDLREGALNIRWERYRFAGTFGVDGSTVTGTWEQAPDGTTWQYWYDLELQRHD